MGVLCGRGAVLGGQRGAGYRWASAIDLIYRIKMVVVRASGTLIVSSLKRNALLTLGVRPARGPGSVRDGGTEGAPGRGDRGGPGTGGHGGPALRIIVTTRNYTFPWGADLC